MPRQSATIVNPELLHRDLEELDRILHRIKTRMNIRPSIADSVESTNLAAVWKRTAGTISQKRAEEILTSIERSRQEWDSNSAQVAQLWQSKKT